MNRTGQPKKQFCINGHDTVLFGRYAGNYECKKCSQERWLRNPDHARDLKYQSKFGITLGQYNTMLAQQGGLCLGCYKHQKDIKRVFAVDHDHKTGVIRGLLCGNCNVALGNAQDDPVILRRLADYRESRGVVPSQSH